jgi:hypothetical protein
MSEASSNNVNSTLINAQFNFRKTQALHRNYEDTINNRPKNTNIAYQAKQAEFTTWCLNEQCQDGDTVSSAKLLLFLEENVKGRKSKKNSNVQIGEGS